MKNEPFYITTPIYYVNDVPHLGTAYCTIAADVLARFERLLGREVRFLTGTDEHGEKIQEAANKKGLSAQAFTDEISQQFKTTWLKLGITFDDFIRTTEERHKEVVQHYIQKALQKGDIYLGEYEGWYCVPDETFWTQAQLVDEKCPTCGRDVKKIKEENYFFKISRYTEKLLQHIDANPGFILPESKKNEVVSFLKEGVRDISVSRTSFTWGVPFPQTDQTKSQHVMYVWFDALINYISALSPLKSSEMVNKFWGTESQPRAVHLIGKDILRFHAVYWPCLLMSLELPLPKRIFAHGWWTIEGKKMSKSLGNTIEPLSFTQQYGQDAFRLFLFREFPMGHDGDFSLKNFKERVNADLANNLGNLLNRSSGLLIKHLEGAIQPPTGSDPLLTPVTDAVIAAHEYLYAAGSLNDLPMERFEFHECLQKIFPILTALNKFVDSKAPWTLAKDPTKKIELQFVLHSVLEGLRIASLMLWPFIPATSDELLKRLGQIGATECLNGKSELTELTKWGKGRPAQLIQGQPLFMRLE
ncbi:MAG: methionine--tRNA ligase [Oligoflexia bacterium]|nr:methionine--tRNA ligase [Oligoflexia bacterium]